MAELSDAFNGFTFDEQSKELDRLLMTNPQMEAKVQKMIRTVLGKARRRMTQRARQIVTNDPREAYKAIKTATYKRILGGNISILDRKKRRNGAVSYLPTRKLVQGQRGGNRMKVSRRTREVNSYQGEDRAFILRFVNSGTGTRYAGSRQEGMALAHRGKITARNWFNTAAQSEMYDAMDQLKTLIDEEYEKLIK